MFLILLVGICKNMYHFVGILYGVRFLSHCTIICINQSILYVLQFA